MLAAYLRLSKYELVGRLRTKKMFASHISRTAFAAIAILCTSAFQISGAEIGDPVIRRAQFDGGTGQLFVYAGAFPIVSERVSSWSFFSDNTASNGCSTGMDSYVCFPGASITPVILEKTATNVFKVTGIGTTRPNSLSGAQTHPFGLVSGTDIVGPNSTFGFRSGGPSDSGDFDFGVAQFDNSSSLGYFYFGERVQISLGNSYAGSGPSRAYSVKFFTSPATLSQEICLLYDPSKAVKSGATIPIKIQLCDSNRNNISSASIVVNATGLVRVSTNTSSDVQDSGNANPDSNFRFDAGLGGTGGYIFNLKTSALLSGTYQLSFTASNSSVTYKVEFQVK